MTSYLRATHNLQQDYLGPFNCEPGFIHDLSSTKSMRLDDRYGNTSL